MSSCLDLQNFGEEGRGQDKGQDHQKNIICDHFVKQNTFFSLESLNGGQTGGGKKKIKG